MSYRSKEKKRKAKIAIRQTKLQHREAMATRYYRTDVKRPCRCSACGKRLRVGDEMVYRHNGKVTLCIPHADGDPLVDYRTSVRWEEKRKRDRKRRSSQSAWSGEEAQDSA